MEELARGVRDLHDRVERLDGLLHERTVVADLRERRADAAHHTAERTQGRVRRLAVALTLAVSIWTPLTAYSAVWMHERVRNTCLPDVLLVQVLDGDQTPSIDKEPWYCGMFPGTGRPVKDSYGPAGE